MLRRTKNSPGVDLGLPPMEEVLLLVPLSPLQKIWYEKLIKKTDTAILHELFDDSQEKTASTNPALKSTSTGNSSDKKRTTWQSLMNLVIQLRKVCNHPYQFEDAEPDPYFPGQHLIEASGKFIVLEKLVTELVIKQKKKIIIFSGFTKMLDLVQELLVLKGGDGSVFNTCRIDGSTGRARRNLAIRMFMDLTSNHNIFLISTRAGGLGLNLAAASEIILLDQDWNPQVTKQAIGRAYRIGLKNSLTVYQFVAQGTVEEQMMPRIAKKLYLSAKVTESMEDIYTQVTPSSKGKANEISSGDNNEMPEMNTTQLMTLIRRGTAAISRPEIDVSKMLEWDWETTIKMCKDQAAGLLVRKEVTEDSNVDEDQAEREWLAEREHVQSRLFNGETIEDRRLKSSKSSEEFAPLGSRADRRIGKERTVMMGGYMVSKDSINNNQWEAIKTFSSANAKSSAPKREKKPDINSQKYCQVCKVVGDSPLILCKVCPRVYHNECLTHIYQAKAKKFQFACPQHSCKDCKQKAGDVGGMLYRCRWCEKAQCEDCIDWRGFKPLGDTLTEFDILGFAKTPSAFYIHCQDCAEKFEKDKKFKDLCEGFEKKWAEELEKMNAVDEELDVKTEMEVEEKTEDEGGANKPIIIEDNDDDVEGVVEMPVTAVMKPQSNVDFRNHRGHQGVQNGTGNIQRQQATQSSNDSESATPSRPRIGTRVEAKSVRRRTFMDRWNEPPVSQSLPENLPRRLGMNMVNGNDNENDNGGGQAGPGGYAAIGFGYSSMFNVPRQMVQSGGNYMVGPSEMRPADTDMRMVDAQYGYGRYNAQATNGAYFLSGAGSNGGGHGNLINVPRHSGQPDPSYVSPYRIHAGGYGNMQNVPRQSGQSGQLQHHVSPQGTNPGHHGSAVKAPRYYGQPQPVTAPTVATSGRRDIEGAVTKSQKSFHG
ncbi:hypothetical protein EAF04_004686 [Stromatinia cepivora]|nr:hypothetical protein EAF04_004686 [Stromatinia cepivora]